MKSFLVAISLLLVPLGLSAQCASDIDRIMLRANESLAAEDYRLAIERLLFARDECPDRKDAINALIKETFAQIDREKREADSALAVAERVLDKLYFYEDKFGLTLKNVGSEFQPKYRYGYINRQGEEVIPFAFEEAAPFSREDGFARVKQEGKTYLLDTLGRSYLLATSLSELTQETQALDLHEQLPDSLPAAVGTYASLRVILAYGNFRRGNLRQLPREITHLQKLQVLNLGHNALDSLPSSFGNLTRLQTLNLERNHLQQLPASFAQLEQLQSLKLGHNQLSQIPLDTVQLRYLKTLDLSYNNLTHLPPSISQSSQLRSLFVNHNQLRELPPSIGHLSKLTQLELNGNPLTSLPAAIGKLEQLRSLFVQDNQLRELPSSIGQLSKLTRLELNGNQLTSLPATMGQLKQLETLHLSSNQLRELPDEMGRLSKLKVVFLIGNLLQELPDSFEQLTQLEALLLSLNQFTQAPALLCKLTRLQADYLQLVDNPLTSLSSCYLDKISTKDLTMLADRFLENNQFQVAYQCVENLVGRFPNSPIRGQAYLLKQLDQLEASGITHEDFPKMRALLKPKE